jgi:hypothetical protein
MVSWPRRWTTRVWPAPSHPSHISVAGAVATATHRASPVALATAVAGSIVTSGGEMQSIQRRP